MPRILNLTVEKDRYNVGDVVSTIGVDAFTVRGAEARMEVKISHEHVIDLVLPAADGHIEDALMELSLDVLRQLPILDNQVQESAAHDCSQSSLHPRNYESVLSHISVRPGSAVLHYFGAVVNTEWDELFIKRSDGSWAHEGTGGPF